MVHSAKTIALVTSWEVLLTAFPDSLFEQVLKFEQ